MWQKVKGSGFHVEKMALNDLQLPATTGHPTQSSDKLTPLKRLHPPVQSGMSQSSLLEQHRPAGPVLSWKWTSYAVSAMPHHCGCLDGKKNAGKGIQCQVMVVGT